MKNPIENEIYKTIISDCEELENTIGGFNGHHFAQKLTSKISEMLLSKQEKIVYNCLNKDNYLSCKEISLLCNMPTKKISTILKSVYSKTLLISIDKSSDKFKYCKRK